MSLTARWIDLDQDGDLDLYVINNAAKEHAERPLTDHPHPGMANIVYRNDGKPPPTPVSPETSPSPLATSTPFSREYYHITAGLSIAFSPWPDSAALAGGNDRHTGVAALDIDGDRDLDLILTADGAVPRVALNDRLGRFTRSS